MLVAGSIVLVVAALLLATAFLNRIADRAGQERYRRIVETPTTPIAQLAAGGLVEIHGRASAGSQGYVASPVTRRQLLTCYVDVRTYSPRGSGGNYWSARYSDDHRRDFWLDDGSGKRAYIALDQAKLVVGGTRYATFGDDHMGSIPHVDVPMDAAPLTQAMLQWATQATGRTDEDHAIHEHAIAEGDYVYAIGEASMQDGTLVLRQTAENDVLVSNLSEQQLRQLYESKARTTQWFFRIAFVVAIAGLVLSAIHFLS